jgi:hypothetical protein
MKNIIDIIKSIIKFLEYQDNPIGVAILFLVGFSISIFLQINEIVLFPYQMLIIIILSLTLLPLLLLPFMAVLFWICVAISHLYDYISPKAESFSLFRKRRKFNFFKALFFTLKSKKIRKILDLYLRQQIASENKYFRQYRGQNKKFINNGLFSACQNGRLDEVQYLLTSPELKENADINFGDDSYIGNPLTNACFGGHLEIVQYLLFSKTLKENVKIANFGTSAFEAAFLNNHIHILKYLIFEIKIEKTEEIKKIIAHSPITGSSNIDNLFQIRELNSKLNNELHTNQIKQQTMKI